MRNLENNGTEEIGLVNPTSEALILLLNQYGSVDNSYHFSI